MLVSGVGLWPQLRNFNCLGQGNCSDWVEVSELGHTYGKSAPCGFT